jgi:hypothetical protein
MAAEYTLRRADGQPFGSFEQVQGLIRRHFPAVEFAWMASGAERLRAAAERGVEVPPDLVPYLENLPSLLEGYVRGDGYHVTFGLGYEEPVVRLYATPRGVADEMYRGLAGLEAEAGDEFKFSGDD